MPADMSLPDSNQLKSFWAHPEGKTAMLTLAAIGAGVIWFFGTISDFLVNMMEDTVHMAYLGGILFGMGYLAFSPRMHLLYRVILRKLTSLIVPTYAIQIIEDKLVQMKKRRDKMQTQIGLVRGAIEQLKRKIDANHAEANKRFGMATYADHQIAKVEDQQKQLELELDKKRESRKAQRRENANIGFTKLLERLQKIYGFLSRYAANINYYIEDTTDEIDMKKTEYETTMAASGAMKQAMAVISGNATEEDIYDQAFASIEQQISTQLGVMDDLERISTDFMSGMDLQKGAIDEAALSALNDFEQKALNTSDNPDLNMVVADTAKRGIVPVHTVGVPQVVVPTSATSDYNRFL